MVLPHTPPKKIKDLQRVPINFKLLLLVNAFPLLLSTPAISESMLGLATLILLLILEHDKLLLATGPLHYCPC